MAKVADELLGFIVDRLDIGVVIFNQDLEVQLWNRFMAANSGKSAEEVIGNKLPDLFPELPVRWLKKKIDSVFILKNSAFTAWQQRPFLFQFAHNRPVTGGVEHMYQNCTFIPLKDSSGDVNLVCMTLQDVTDEGISQKLLQATMLRLEESSRTDGLTQLLNRSYWEFCLARELKRFNRYGNRASLIMFDLDHFKSINDNYGHLAGDEVLRRVAETLRDTVRETDISGRYGGEEFGVIVTESDVEGAKLLAERIRKNIEALDIVHESHKIPVTVSLGVTEFQVSISNHEEVISRADQALYESKENGRNRFTVFEEMDS